MPVLFGGDDLRVSLREHPSTTVVVTFTHAFWAEPHTGFLEDRLDALGVAAICFTSLRDHFFLTGEMEAAIAAVRASGALADRRVVLAGGSMGGYAALRWSRALDADEVVALIPQGSPDEAKVADRRWAALRNQAEMSLDDLADGISRSARICVCYDPRLPLDAAHVAYVERHRPIDRVVAPFLAHRVGGHLKIDRGLDEFASLLAAAYDPRALRRVIRQRRLASTPYLYGLCATLVRRGRHLDQARSTAAYAQARGLAGTDGFAAVIEALGGSEAL